MSTSLHIKLPVGQPHFTPPAIAQALGLNAGTITRWCRQGLIDAWRAPSGHWHISASTAAAIIRRSAHLEARP